MIIFHLSHTDLDGYSCQIVSSYFCDEIYFYNSNYGLEVTAKLNKIEQDIKQLSTKQEILLLITDLNISLEECDLAQKIVSRASFLGANIKLCLLDHHLSGEKQAKKFDWYFLDDKRCATKITYDYFVKNYPKIKIPNELKTYVDAVNAFDIWLTTNELFEFGKVLNRANLETKEINTNLFTKESFLYKKDILQKSFSYLKDNKYIDYDNDILKLKKEFLAQNAQTDTIDNLTSNYILSLLNANKENMTVHIMEKKGILTSSIGNTSVLGNAFLVSNPDFEFFMDVGGTGNVSLRSNSKANVSQMAEKLFNGGGHPNAAGGKILGLKEAYIYSSLKRQITERFS